MKTIEEIKAYRKAWRLKNRQKVNKWQREWFKKNRKKVNFYRRNWNKKIRLQALAHYGSKCQCCGETTIEFLQIDHKNNNGNAHRKADPNVFQLAYWLIRNNFPKGFQILCSNCHTAKTIYKMCPHQNRILTR